MTDWLMVIITAVYVVATIFIWIANKRSADASMKQLEESKRQFEKSQEQAKEQMAAQEKQYEETKRLSMMPLFEMYKSDHTLGDYYWDIYDPEYKHFRSVITLKNIGLGNAKNIIYDCECPEIKYFDRGKPLESSALLSSESINIGIEHKQNCTLIITFSFQDLLENNYKQVIEIKFDSKESHIKNYPIERTEKSND